jgi:hypothetical protein
MVEDVRADLSELRRVKPSVVDDLKRFLKDQKVPELLSLDPKVTAEYLDDIRKYEEKISNLTSSLAEAIRTGNVHTFVTDYLSYYTVPVRHNEKRSDTPRLSKAGRS